VQSKLLEIPGVEAASASSHLPLDANYANWYDGYYKEGAPPEDQNTNLADDRSILPGFFQTIGATLISGRDFSDADDAARQHVAIVDDELAAREWPGQSALGKKLNISDSPKGFYEFERDWVVVVGVVRHVQYHSLTTSVRPAHRRRRYAPRFVRSWTKWTRARRWLAWSRSASLRIRRGRKTVSWRISLQHWLESRCCWLAWELPE